MVGLWLAFFGVDHVVYGSDMPFDQEGGYFDVRETMRSLDAALIAPADRQKIYETNARGLSLFSDGGYNFGLQLF